jgi:hypothetical protein
VAFILQALGSDDLAFLHGGVSFPLCKLKKVLHAAEGVSIYGTQSPPGGCGSDFRALPGKCASAFFVLPDCCPKIIHSLPKDLQRPPQRAKMGAVGAVVYKTMPPQKMPPPPRSCSIGSFSGGAELIFRPADRHGQPGTVSVKGPKLNCSLGSLKRKT